MSDLENVEILEPWVSLSSERAASFEKELARELAPAHRLYRKPARALACRCDRDDVLFEIAGEGVAVVHLTYAIETDAHWPAVEPYATFDEWIERRMKPDHAEWD